MGWCNACGALGQVPRTVWDQKVLAMIMVVIIIMTVVSFTNCTLWASKDCVVPLQTIHFLCFEVRSALNNFCCFHGYRNMAVTFLPVFLPSSLSPYLFHADPAEFVMSSTCSFKDSVSHSAISRLNSVCCINESSFTLPSLALLRLGQLIRTLDFKMPFPGPAVWPSS